jgi:four helix bundle protein
VQSFKNLKVWEKAHVLTLDVYKSSKSFPRDEIYGLTSQMRRSAASIGANIAEGSCRKGDCEFGRFLQIAMGSASELEYHLISARSRTVEVNGLRAAFRRGGRSKTYAFFVPF